LDTVLFGPVIVAYNVSLSLRTGPSFTE